MCDYVANGSDRAIYDMAVRTTGAGGARAPLTSKAGSLAPLKIF